MNMDMDMDMKHGTWNMEHGLGHRCGMHAYVMLHIARGQYGVYTKQDLLRYASTMSMKSAHWGVDGGVGGGGLG